MTFPSFHRPRPAERQADLREPMPWLSRSRTGGIYRLPGLQYPLGSLIYGLVFIALGIIALVATAGSGAMAAGIPIFVIAAGMGTWLVIIAAVRWPWHRKYVQQHGHPPF